MLTVTELDTNVSWRSCKVDQEAYAHPASPPLNTIVSSDVFFFIQVKLKQKQKQKQKKIPGKFSQNSVALDETVATTVTKQRYFIEERYTGLESCHLFFHRET